MDGESPRDRPLEKQPQLVDVLARLARDWVNCRSRYGRSSCKWKANIAAAERDLKTAVASSESSDKDLHDLRKKIYLLKEKARRERGSEEFMRRWESFHQHPFPDACGWAARMTGSKQRGIQVAAIANFEGHPRLVFRLQRLNDAGKAVPLFRQLLSEHPELAAKSGLSSGNLVAADRQPTHWESVGPLPKTAITGVASHAKRTPADVLTTEELARLAMVKRKTLLNKLSQARGTDFRGVRPPQSTGVSGSIPESYSYAAIRPFLLASWPTKRFRFPEGFEEVKLILGV